MRWFRHEGPILDAPLSYHILCRDDDESENRAVFVTWLNLRIQRIKEDRVENVGKQNITINIFTYKNDKIILIEATSFYPIDTKIIIWSWIVQKWRIASKEIKLLFVHSKVKMAAGDMDAPIRVFENWTVQFWHVAKNVEFCLCRLILTHLECSKFWNLSKTGSILNCSNHCSKWMCQIYKLIYFIQLN